MCSCQDLQSAIGAQHEAAEMHRHMSRSFTMPYMSHVQVLKKSIAPAALKSVTLVRMDERPEEAPEQIGGRNRKSGMSSTVIPQCAHVFALSARTLKVRLAIERERMIDAIKDWSCPFFALCNTEERTRTNDLFTTECRCPSAAPNTFSC